MFLFVHNALYTLKSQHSNASSFTPKEHSGIIINLNNWIPSQVFIKETCS